LIKEERFTECEAIKIEILELKKDLQRLEDIKPTKKEGSKVSLQQMSSNIQMVLHFTYFM